MWRASSPSMRVWYEAMPAGSGSPVASPTGKRRGHEMEERYAEPLKSASVSRSSAHWRYENFVVGRHVPRVAAIDSLAGRVGRGVPDARVAVAVGRAALDSLGGGGSAPAAAGRGGLDHPAAR